MSFRPSSKNSVNTNDIFVKRIVLQTYDCPSVPSSRSPYIPSVVSRRFDAGVVVPTVSSSTRPALAEGPAMIVNAQHKYDDTASISQ